MTGSALRARHVPFRPSCRRMRALRIVRMIVAVSLTAGGMLPVPSIPAQEQEPALGVTVRGILLEADGRPASGG